MEGGHNSITQAVTAAYAALQLAILVVLAIDTQKTSNGLSLGAAAVSLVAAAFMLVVSFAEHSRSPRPSFLLNGYILLTIILDVAQVRTSWLVATPSQGTLFARLFTSSVATKALLLLLEAHPKSRWLRWNLDKHSPEEVYGILGLGVYGWLNQLFLRGYGAVLRLKDLYPLDSNMTVEVLHPKLQRQLQSPSYRSSKYSLAKALGKALIVPWLLPVAPRICLIGFKFAQPLFLQSLLAYLQASYDSDTMKKNVGYGLIGAAGLAYLGLAFSNAFFRYYKYRAVYMIRSCLCAALYKKSTEAMSVAGGDAAAISLMSTDMERIVRAFDAIHDLWASFIELAIACWLLYRHIGAAFVAPLLTIIVCTGVVVLSSKFSGRRQRRWMAGIQKRVGVTARAIADIKGLKIAGLVEHVYHNVQNLRLAEIGYGNGWRVLLLVTALFAMAPTALAPLFTFAVTARDLDTTTIYTSLAYINLVTTPLIMILQRLPELAGALACIGRIQKFLEETPRVEYRKFARSTRPTEKVPVSSGASSGGAQEKSVPRTPSPGATQWTSRATNGSETSAAAVTLSNCSFGWAEEKMSLKDISTVIPTGQLTMVIGPVGSGKSTFCHALLGEVPYASGDITLNTYTEGIGFCAQSPFLLNATFKENIIGFVPFDQVKYDEIIKATRLDIDVALMPSGHDTNIGSNGIILSGGQKQRVSLARALYLGSDMVIFDDILSGLDNDTETEVFNRVFGAEGILRRRGMTTIICTHSIRHLPSADHIIALGSDGTLVEDGSFEDLMRNNMYVQNLGVKASSSSASVASSGTTADGPSAEPAAAAIPKPKVYEEKLDKARQLGDWKVYGHYAGSIKWPMWVVMLALMAVAGFSEHFSTLWLGYWSEDKFSRTNAFYLGIFALFRASHLLWLLVVAVMILISLVTLSGTALHSNALKTVLTAPLSFFTNTDIGVVTNLFSQDMMIIDSELPLALLNMVFSPFALIAMAAVIAVATPYVLCGYIVVGIALYFLQKFYLRTSRQIRLLDLEAKSPL